MAAYLLYMHERIKNRLETYTGVPITSQKHYPSYIDPFTLADSENNVRNGQMGKYRHGKQNAVQINNYMQSKIFLLIN